MFTSEITAKQNTTLPYLSSIDTKLFVPKRLWLKGTATKKASRAQVKKFEHIQILVTWEPHPEQADWQTHLKHYLLVISLVGGKNVKAKDIVTFRSIDFCSHCYWYLNPFSFSWCLLISCHSFIIISIVIVFANMKLWQEVDRPFLNNIKHYQCLKNGVSIFNKIGLRGLSGLKLQQTKPWVK